MKIFAGSEVSIFTLEKAYSAGVTPEQSQTLINQAALAEFMRGLGFVPLIATTALATGVYAVAGFTFVYAVGYLSPNPMVAAVLGAVVISAEVLPLRSIGKWLGRYPSVRNASDSIRNAMNMLMKKWRCWSVRFSQQLRWRVIPVFSSRLPFTSSTNPWAVRYRNGGTGCGSNDHRHPAGCSLLVWPVYSGLRNAPMKTFPLQSLTLNEAQQKQFALVRPSAAISPAASFLLAVI